MVKILSPLFIFSTTVPSVLMKDALSTALNVYNYGQKVGDKFTKLNKTGFSMECFTADFLQFFNKKHQNLTFGWTTGYSKLNPNISGIFLKLPKS